MLISLIAAAVAIPGYGTITRYLRIAGDSRDLNGSIAQAKMRAAQDFTHARLRANLGANTFQLEVWNKAGNGGAGCWQTEGDPTNPCTVPASPAQLLSQGVSFGFGNVGAALPNPQTVIALAPPCLRGVAGGTALGIIDGTACIEFNSRGIPVSAGGSPATNDALYVTDNNTVYGVTLIASGMMQQWATSASTTNWQPR
jgi:hypothetical protein